ncbi:MAG: type II secretion system F family protein [Deltaproteobacteria bacterium]
MSVFAYTGVNEKGRSVRGTIDADTIKTARQMLRRKGFFLEEAKALEDGATGAKTTQAARAAQQVTGTTEGASAFATFGRVWRSIKQLASNPLQSVALATRQLATLLKAGVPLPESIDALVEQIDHDGLRDAFSQVAVRVKEGISFAKALEEHPKLFDTLFVSMVSAGEASGNMDAVLNRLADFTESQLKLKNKVVGALAYPAFMAVFGTMTIGVMMVVVVPKVSAIYEDFKRALPWYTQVLITTSRFVGNYWWLLIIMGVVGTIVFNRWRATPEGAFKWDAFVLRLPVFGDLARMVAIARFTRTLATLLSSGVPLLKAMDIVKNVLGNKVLENVVSEAAVSIKEGESIAEPLKRSGKFPPMVTHMIAIGERAGELEGMLEAVASSYDNNIDARVAVLTSLLEPMMIAVMGGASGGITFAILMPLLQLNEFVQ